MYVDLPGCPMSVASVQQRLDPATQPYLALNGLRRRITFTPLRYC
jgi:hypothetical protein